MFVCPGYHAYFPCNTLITITFTWILCFKSKMRDKIPLKTSEECLTHLPMHSNYFPGNKAYNPTSAIC